MCGRSCIKSYRTAFTCCWPVTTWVLACCSTSSQCITSPSSKDTVKNYNYIHMLRFITRYMSLVCYLVNLSLILPTSFLLPHLNSVLCVAVLEGVSLQISCSGHQATIITSNHMTHSNCWQLVFHNAAMHQSVHLCDVQAAFLLSSYWNVWGRTTGVPKPDL